MEPILAILPGLLAGALGANILGGVLGAIGASKKRKTQQQVQLTAEDAQRLNEALGGLQEQVPQFQQRLQALAPALQQQLKAQAPNLLAPSLDPLTQLILSQGAQQAGQRTAAATTQIQRTIGKTQPGVARALASQAALRQAGQVNALLLPALQQQLAARQAQAQLGLQQQASQRAAAGLLGQLAGQQLAGQQSLLDQIRQIAALRAGRTTTQPGTPFLQTFGRSLAGAGQALGISGLGLGSSPSNLQQIIKKTASGVTPTSPLAAGFLKGFGG